MRAGVRFTVLAGALLTLGGFGSAQNRDPDRFGMAKTSASAPSPAERVDINHASFLELMEVPGMTESWARRVIRFRPYHTKLDLLENGVVSSQVYDGIKDFVIAHRDAR